MSWLTNGMAVSSCTTLWTDSWLGPDFLPHVSLQLCCSSTQFFLVVSIFGFLHLQKQRLARNPYAASSGVIILPIHHRVLAAFLVVTGLQLVVVLVLPVRLLKHRQLQVALLAFGEAIKRGVLELVAFLLVQPGAGANATLRASVWALCWGLCVWLLFCLQYLYSSSINWYFAAVYHLLLVGLYFGLLLPPCNRFFRPALRNYALYWSLQSLVALVADAILAFTAEKEVGYCVGISADAISALLTAYMLYRTLLVDSRYWQGLNREKKPKKSAPHSLDGSEFTCSLTSPLMGIHLGRDTARSLATFAEVENCGQVQVLSQTYLKLSKKLAAGGHAQVWEGQWRDNEVAVKIYYCIEITPETVGITPPLVTVLLIASPPLCHPLSSR